MCLNLFSKKHPSAKIIPPVNYPPVVEQNTPFDITYTIKNVGDAAGNIWAYLEADGVKLPLSEWKQRVSINGTVTKTYHHKGINKNTSIILQTGY